MSRTSREIVSADKNPLSGNSSSGNPSTTRIVHAPFFVPTCVATSALLLPALLVWAVGWEWAPSGTGGMWLSLNLLVTETGSFPYAIVTSVILASVLVWLIGVSGRRAAAVLVLCAAVIGYGQITKSILKNTFQEARPYVVWLEESHGLKRELFYKHTREARAAWLQQNIANDERVPAPLLEHWKDETGFSFPSGHSLFVSSWALLGVALLWRADTRYRRRGRVFCATLIAWSLAVEATRLTLGMHWSQDVAMGVLQSGTIVIALVAIWKKCVTKWASGSLT